MKGFSYMTTCISTWHMFNEHSHRGNDLLFLLHKPPHGFLPLVGVRPWMSQNCCCHIPDACTYVHTCIHVFVYICRARKCFYHELIYRIACFCIGIDVDLTYMYVYTCMYIFVCAQLAYMYMHMYNVCSRYDFAIQYR